MRVGTSDDCGASEQPIALDDGSGRVGLGGRLAQAARVDLERGPGLDEGDEQRFVQLRRRTELGRRDVRHEVALHEIEMADRVEQARSDRAPDLIEVRGDDVRERSAGGPGRDASRVERRVCIHVDAPDHVVVRVPGQVVADVLLVGPVVGDLDPEADRDAVPRPALRSVSRDPFALGEGREREGRRARHEIDMIGDGELGDPALDGFGRVRVDRDVGVGRQVRMEVGVEGQVAGLGRELGVRHPAISPSSRPTLANASRARSSWASAWAAVTIVRIRALSIATVGKTTGWAKTPSSNRRWLNRPAVSGSPIMTGVIGVSDRPVSKPSRASSALKRFVFDQSRSSSSGSSCITLIAAMQAAATAGGCDVENRNGRARWMRMSRRSWEPATYPPSTPTALLSVPTWIATRPWSPKWSTEPRPSLPRTPDAWASSTKTAALADSAASTMPGSGAMSPSMLNTPSVTTRIRRYGRPVPSRPFSTASSRTARRASTSACL